MSAPLKPHENLTNEILKRLFEHNGKPYPRSFRPGSISANSIIDVLTLIHSKTSIATAEKDYLKSLGYSSAVAIDDFFIRKIRHSITSHLQCMLTIPEYSSLVFDYIFKNKNQYLEITPSFFGQSVSNFRDAIQPRSGKIVPVANICRKECGELRIANPGIVTKSDAHAFLMSAIANRDSHAVDELIDTCNFKKFLSIEQVKNIVTDVDKRYPELCLKDNFGIYFKIRTNANYLLETKLLLQNPLSTNERYREAYWDGALPQAHDEIVGYAFGPFRHELHGSRDLFFKMMREIGVDLYPGMYKAHKGRGEYLDLVSNPIDIGLKIQRILDFASSMTKNAPKAAIGPILLDVPLDDILSHSKRDVFVKEIYLFTGDRKYLGMMPESQRGKVLEAKLGL